MLILCGGGAPWLFYSSVCIPVMRVRPGIALIDNKIYINNMQSLSCNKYSKYMIRLNR